MTGYSSQDIPGAQPMPSGHKSASGNRSPFLYNVRITNHSLKVLRPIRRTPLNHPYDRLLRESAIEKPNTSSPPGCVQEIGEVKSVPAEEWAANTAQDGSEHESH